MGLVMMHLLAVFIGSALGGLCRYLLSGAVARRVGERFPYGTLVVNVSGALVIGLVWSLPGASAAVPLEDFRFFMMYGFLGGYTTVSSFTLNTLNLMQDREWLPAGLNIAGTYSLCLLAVYIGVSLPRLFT